MLEADLNDNTMQLQQNVGREVVVGVLIGGLFLSGILYMLNTTEDQAIALTYVSASSSE